VAIGEMALTVSEFCRQTLITQFQKNPLLRWPNVQLAAIKPACLAERFNTRWLCSLVKGSTLVFFIVLGFLAPHREISGTVGHGVTPKNLLDVKNEIRPIGTGFIKREPKLFSREKKQNSVLGFWHHTGRSREPLVMGSHQSTC